MVQCQLQSRLPTKVFSLISTDLLIVAYNNQHFRGTHYLLIEASIIRIYGMPIMGGETLFQSLFQWTRRLAHFVHHIERHCSEYHALRYHNNKRGWLTATFNICRVDNFTLWEMPQMISDIVKRGRECDWVSNTNWEAFPSKLIPMRILTMLKPKTKGVTKRNRNTLKFDIVLPSINCRSHWKRSRP